MSPIGRWNDPFRGKADPRATVARNRSWLMGMDGVVSVGLGFDVHHRTVIVVGVTSGAEADSVAVPNDLDGVPVEVRVSGALAVQDEPGRGGAGTEDDA